MTLSNALKFGTRSGVVTALGIACGIIVHMSYCIAGIGLMIARSSLLFNTIKWIGAAYLFYIGFHAIRSKGMDGEAVEAGRHELSVPQPLLKSFRAGFITNLFNPKATMFFLALFSQMLKPGIPLHAVLILASACLVTAFLWFTGVSIAVTRKPMRRFYIRASRWIDRIAGAFFIGFGVKLAVSKI